MIPSFRAIWIVEAPEVSSESFSKKNSNGRGSIIYTRTFSMIEEQCKKRDEENYVSIPDNDILLNSILTEVGKHSDIQFVNHRDRCNKKDEKPIFKVHIGNNNYLYPVLILEQAGFLYCCLCHTEQPLSSLIDESSVSSGFSFLRCLTDYFRVSSIQEFQSRLNDLPVFINEAAPFGIPRDTNCDSIQSKISDKTSQVMKSIKTKQPAWKPSLHKNKSTIYLSISECIQATQCEKDGKDKLEVYGSMTCRAELEGSTPDITLNISHINEGFIAPLDNLIIHHCVQSADSTPIIHESRSIVRPAPRKIRFIPPYEGFMLCQYTVSKIQELPIFGVYDMKIEQNTANLSVNLQLSDQVKNNFEYAELQIPFLERGTLTIIDSNISQGSLTLSPDKHVLVWNIGPKFPSKTLYVTLTALVQFSDKNIVAEPNTVDSAEQNTYCQLYFKIPDFTYSGCYIDPKSLQVSPSAKFKLTTKREFLSTTYKIWNTNDKVSA